MIFRLVASNLPPWLQWNYANNIQSLIIPRTEEVSYRISSGISKNIF